MVTAINVSQLPDSCSVHATVVDHNIEAVPGMQNRVFAAGLTSDNLSLV